MGDNWFGFTPESKIWLVIFIGLFNTITISFIAMVCSTVFGTLIGLMPFSGMLIFNKAFISIFRNVPLYVQLLAWYFGCFYMLPEVSSSITFGGLFLNIKGILSLLFKDNRLKQKSKNSFLKTVSFKFDTTLLLFFTKIFSDKQV